MVHARCEGAQYELQVVQLVVTALYQRGWSITRFVAFGRRLSSDCRYV